MVQCRINALPGFFRISFGMKTNCLFDFINTTLFLENLTSIQYIADRSNNSNNQSLLKTNESNQFVICGIFLFILFYTPVAQHSS